MKSRETLFDAALIVVSIGLLIYGLFFAEPSWPLALDPWGAPYPW